MTPRTYPILRTASPIVVDGDLTKSAWNTAPWTEAFVDIEGDKRPKPRHLTRAKMLWDDHFLYIAAEMEEPHLWATLTETDSVIFQDNDFEVFIDPDGDSHHYAEIEINALGTTWDLFLPRPYKDGGMPLTGWRFKGVQTAVRLQGTLNDPTDLDKGWTVEIAIPWTALKEICRCDCPPSFGNRWRMNFSRVHWDLELANGRYQKIPNRPEYNWVWSPQGVIDMHRPEHWGIVQFCNTDPTITPDESLEARALLHQAYYTARAYHVVHGHWPASLDLAGVEVHTTPTFFEAIANVTYSDGSNHQWHIAGDGAIWEDESYELKCIRGDFIYRPDFGSPTIASS